VRSSKYREKEPIQGLDLHNISGISKDIQEEKGDKSMMKLHKEIE